MIIKNEYEKKDLYHCHYYYVIKIYFFEIY